MIFRIVLNLLILSMVAGFGGTVIAHPEMERVFIGFENIPGNSEEAVVQQVGGKVKYTYHLVPAIAAELPKAAIEGLIKNPKVTYIEPDLDVFAIDVELDNSWGVKRIGAGIVHDDGNKGTGIKVAIIDTGIDYNHPDLDANYVGGYDFVNNDSDPMDDNGHGTHCAGIIAAEDNDTGVVGVAPEAKLYAVKVLNQYGKGSYSDVVAALEWSVDNGMQVTSNSYGSAGNPGETVKQAFDNAYAAGVLSIAAAGNNYHSSPDTVIYPARYDSVVAISATDSSDYLASFSSAGPAVELAAPGVNVYSTIPGNSYGTKSGTSMACPHVSGTAALVLASNPSWANSQIRAQLGDTAEDLGVPGRDTWYGYGLVDADTAVLPAPEPGVFINLTSDKDEYLVGTPGALLIADVNDEFSHPITGLAVEAFVTTVKGVQQEVLFGETTVGIYEGSLDISTMQAGTYDVVVTVTDSRNLSGVGATSFTIIKFRWVVAKNTRFLVICHGSCKLMLRVNVTADDIGGPPVGAAVVTVLIIDPTSRQRVESRRTDDFGTVTFRTRPGKMVAGLWSAWVTNIEAAGYAFDPTKGGTYDEITIHVKK